MCTRSHFARRLRCDESDNQEHRSSDFDSRLATPPGPPSPPAYSLSVKFAKSAAQKTVRFYLTWATLVYLLKKTNVVTMKIGMRIAPE
jgi:hypothetical protein